MKTGQLTNVLVNEKYYEILVENEGVYKLIFGEAPRLFFVGDEIQFTPYKSPTYGDCAFDPIKIGNKNFDELRNAFETKQIIEGKVIEQNNSGFLVSYKGYQCFLPYYESISNDDSPNLTPNSCYIFNILKIVEHSVYLTRKAILNDELMVLAKREISTLHSGCRFEGTVRRSDVFGIYIRYKHSSGLLHLSSLLSCYNPFATWQTRKEHRKIFKAVFLKGTILNVTIVDISDDRYSVELDMNFEENKKLLARLNLLICET